MKFYGPCRILSTERGTGVISALVWGFTYEVSDKTRRRIESGIWVNGRCTCIRFQNLPSQNRERHRQSVTRQKARQNSFNVRSMASCHSFCFTTSIPTLFTTRLYEILRLLARHSLRTTARCGCKWRSRSAIVASWLRRQPFHRRRLSIPVEKLASELREESRRTGGEAEAALASTSEKLERSFPSYIRSCLA